MSMRVLFLTDQQQEIVKLHLDGKNNQEIMDELNVEEDDIYAALMIVDRKLTKSWRRTAKECWNIIKEWNIASTLVLALCLAPMIEVNNHNNDRVRTPKVKTSKTVRRNDIDLFDLFEFC